MGRRVAAAGCIAVMALAGCTSKTKATTSPPLRPSTIASSFASLSPSEPNPSPSPLGSPSPVPPPAGAAAASISFISLSDAWVLAGTTSTTVVLGTASRGRHWSQVGTVPVPADGTGVTQIRFADASNGRAFDSQLLATHDGGSTWHAVCVPGSVTALEAAGGTAWAVVQAPCAGSSGCTTAGALYRAPVGSDAWQIVAGVSLPPAAGSGGMALHGESVYVFSSPTLLYSSGGAFSALPDPCPVAFTRSGFAASDATNVAVLCEGDAGAGSSTKQVCTSADAGHTHRQISDAPRGGQPTGMASGSAGTIALSATSGASWIYLTSAADRTWSVPLQFGDGGQGWSVGFTEPPTLW